MQKSQSLQTSFGKLKPTNSQKANLGNLYTNLSKENKTKFTTNIRKLVESGKSRNNIHTVIREHTPKRISVRIARNVTRNVVETVINREAERQKKANENQVRNTTRGIFNRVRKQAEEEERERQVVKRREEETLKKLKKEIDKSVFNETRRMMLYTLFKQLKIKKSLLTLNNNDANKIVSIDRDTVRASTVVKKYYKGYKVRKDIIPELKLKAKIVYGQKTRQEAIRKLEEKKVKKTFTDWYVSRNGPGGKNIHFNQAITYALKQANPEQLSRFKLLMEQGKYKDNTDLFRRWLGNNRSNNTNSNSGTTSRIAPVHASPPRMRNNSRTPSSASNSNNNSPLHIPGATLGLAPVRTTTITTSRQNSTSGNNNGSPMTPVNIQNINMKNKLQQYRRNYKLIYPENIVQSRFNVERSGAPRTFFKNMQEKERTAINKRKISGKDKERLLAVLTIHIDERDNLTKEIEKLTKSMDMIRYQFDTTKQYTTEEIIKILKQTIEDYKRIQNIKTKPIYTTTNIKKTRTSPTAMNAIKKNSLNFSIPTQKTSVEPNSQRWSQRVHTTQDAFNRNKIKRNLKVSTREHQISTELFTKTIQTKLILQKIYNKIKPILKERKLYDKSQHTLLSNFIHHFIHQQTVHIHPKNLTGEMIDIVIDNPEDLCNFLCLQKMDIQHDFGGSNTRIKNSSLNYKRGDTPAITRNKAKRRTELQKGIERIQTFVNNGSVTHFVENFKSNIKTINPSVDEQDIDDMFTIIKNNMNNCYVMKNLHVIKTDKESKVFTTLQHMFTLPVGGRKGGIKKRVTQIFPKQFQTLDPLRGHPELAAIYDAASMKEVKVSYDNFKNYIDLTVMADAGQSLRQGFYSFLVDSYQRYKEQIDFSRGEDGWGYIEEKLFHGTGDEEFKKFYKKEIESKLPRLSKVYIATQFVDYVTYIKKKTTGADKNSTVTLKNILRNMINKLNYYKQFMYLQNNQSASPFVFNFATLGFRLYYKPSRDSKVILLNEVIVSANQNSHPDSQDLSASSINGQTDLSVGSSANATGSFIIANDIPETDMYKYLLAKTYGDFLLMVRGLTKNIKYITYDKMAASTYMILGDIMKRNGTRIIHYTKDTKYIEKNFIPRLQLVTESSNDGSGTRLLYIDSEKEDNKYPWINTTGPNRSSSREVKL